MQERNVIEFYVLATKLKDIIRSGWKLWHISKERIESVAEHVYGTCILAIAIDSEYKININLNKVLKMLVIHELEEVFIGDLTPYDEGYDNKIEQGHEAVKKVLNNLIKKNEYFDLINEFDNQSSIEGKFAYSCDKLEADLVAKLYEEQGYSDIYSDDNKEIMSWAFTKPFVNQGGQNLAELYILSDYNKFYFDEFKKLADYAKDNEIDVN